MSARAELEIDHPSSGETIKPGHYAFRISSPEPLSTVDVSVDGGPWRPCRHACGLWWHDWTADKPGAHQVAARAATVSGEAANSTLRRFTVAARSGV